MNETTEKPDAAAQPDWLPDEYEIDAPLRERIWHLPEIDVGIELHAGDDRGIVKVLGQPHEVVEQPNGAIVLRAGFGDEFNWDYEVVIPTEESDTGPYVREVDPDQPHDAYMATKRTILENADVRVFDVDTDKLDERGGA